MENKKNNGLVVAFIIVLVVAVLGIGGTLYFYNKSLNKGNEVKVNTNENDNDNNNVVKDNNTQEEENNVNSRINSELKDAISFTIKDQKEIIAFTSDGKEILIYDFSKSKINYNGKVVSFPASIISNIHYDYDDVENILYLFLVASNSDKFIVSIDLKKGNGNYVPEIITKIELTNAQLSGGEAFGGDAYITKVGNNIYFSHKYLFKYDLQSKKMENMNISSEGKVMKITKYNSNIIYNNNDDIYVLDLSSGKSTKILSNSNIAFMHNNSLIYYFLGDNFRTGKINESTDDSYYYYDLNNNTKQKISNLIGTQFSYDEYIIPFNNEIYSFNGLNLYKYGKQLELVHTFICDDFSGIIDNCTSDKINVINDFLKISKNEMLLKFGNEYAGETFNVIYNIDTKKVINSNNREASQYLMDYYLK